MYIPNFQSVLASALALTALGGKHKDSSNVAKGEVLDFCSPSPSLSRWRASLSWPALGERERADFAPSPAAIDKECLDGDGSVPPSLPRHTPCSSPACLLLRTIARRPTGGASAQPVAETDSAFVRPRPPTPPLLA